MNTLTSRAIAVVAVCAMFGGHCGCIHMSDQLMDYNPFYVPFPVSDEVSAAAASAYLAVSIPVKVTLASTAPQRNALVDETRLDEATGKKWHQRKTTRDYLTVAMTCENAGIRRLAVLKVLDSGDVASDWALEGLEAVARQDSSSSVRWVTIRGLSRVHDPRPVRVALSILNHEQGTENIRPPDVQVRWACLLLLNDYCAQGLVPSTQHEAVQDVMIRHLSQSYHHDVRFTAAKGLRHFEDRGSRIALTHALDDGHLGVALRAKRSLLAFTDTEYAGSNRREQIVSITQ